MTTATNTTENYEDSYSAVEYDSFAELVAVANEFWLPESAFAKWNVPVWIDYDATNDQEHNSGPRVTVGCLQTRHGNTLQHIAPCTPEQLAEVQAIVMRVWIGRAEMGFRRYDA